MYKYYCVFILITLCTTAVAQDGDPHWKEPSKASKQYHEYRLAQSEPPYGLQKIKKLISGIKRDEDDNEALSSKLYQALTLREKFTYHILNEEQYEQICDPVYPPQDEQKKIFSNLGNEYDEYGWSDRQENFFKANRDTVLKLIKERIEAEKHVGLSYKNILVIVNAKEFIPLLIATYNIDKRDHDILTLLMILMKDNKYPPFMESQSYRKLYSDDADYDAYLNFNTANEALIIKRATDFYNGLKK